MPTPLEQARAILATQPFSVLLGTDIEEWGDDRAVLSLVVRDEHRQQNGFVHGGVLAYLVDNAVTFAAATVLGVQVLTAGFTVEYLRPARGPVLLATATVSGSTRGRAVARCEVTEGDRVIAIGQGTVSRVGE